MPRKLFALFFLAWTLGAVAAPTEMRTWTDARGRKVTARAVSMDGGNVVLENAAGARLTVPLSNFSAQDQAYLRQHFSQNAAAAPWPPGEITDAIKTKKDPRWSYHLYLPTSFHMNRQWPVMFIMSFGGGTKETLERYVKGAEFNGWILATSVQSTNSFEHSTEAIMAMVEDVRARLPVDDKRLYSSGCSGGARRAFHLAERPEKPHLAGVLPCAAGDGDVPLSDKVIVYGLCGTDDFNRWDMACTFKEIDNKDSRLRFYVGKHQWPDENLLADAITWFNGCCLRKATNSDKVLLAERDRFAQRLLAEIEQRLDTEPEWAYEWALFLSRFPGPAATIGQAKRRLQALQRQPRIQLYAKALADLDEFVNKHFTTNPGAHHIPSLNGTPEAKRDAEELAEKYKDTILVEIFRRVGKPVPM